MVFIPRCCNTNGTIISIIGRFTWLTFNISISETWIEMRAIKFVYSFFWCNLLVMFIHKCIHVSTLIGYNISQFFKYGRTTMLYFIEYCMQNDDITQGILFKYIDLIEYNICIQHQIMWEWEIWIWWFWCSIQNFIMNTVVTFRTQFRTAPNIITQIVFTYNLNGTTVFWIKTKNLTSKIHFKFFSITFRMLPRLVLRMKILLVSIFYNWSISTWVIQSLI